VLTKRLFKEDEQLEEYNVFDSVDFGNNLRVRDEDFDNSDTSYEQKIKKLQFLEQTINIPQDITKLLDYRLPQIQQSKTDQYAVIDSSEIDENDDLQMLEEEENEEEKD